MKVHTWFWYNRSSTRRVSKRIIMYKPRIKQNKTRHFPILLEGRQRKAVSSSPCLHTHVGEAQAASGIFLVGFKNGVQPQSSLRLGNFHNSSCELIFLPGLIEVAAVCLQMGYAPTKGSIWQGPLPQKPFHPHSQRFGWTGGEAIFPASTCATWDRSAPQPEVAKYTV